VENGRFDASPLEQVDAVVHLAGEPIAQRWNEARKAIREPREARSSGRRIEEPQAPAQSTGLGSAIGFYGDRGDEVLRKLTAGSGFLPETCQAWEHAAMDAMGLGIRTASLRTGIVLSTRGGALKKMLPPFRLGVGGPVGSGRQWMSWIHIDDIVGAIRHILDKDDVMAAVNGVAPEPATNADFSSALGRALSRPAFLPAPPSVSDRFRRDGFHSSRGAGLAEEAPRDRLPLPLPRAPGRLSDVLARKR
jgi:uncharacterized protein (TIGR01777 family)